MTRNRTTFGALLVAAFALLIAPRAKAASLQQVSNWNGGTSFPSDVSMYAYVPDRVATNPPILTLIHYCGGTASAVFGQAQGGGIISAADQYGFIIVAPSSGRCWDIVSNKTRMRDGGGDSHAIRQMVKFALEKYKANPERVYSTGDSSGAMMTELLLALYPDVFKAGSAFAGMPAGCRGANESGSNGGYSGDCAGEKVSHTPEEWGDIVRMMDPGYTGHRPRVQLFHGDADDTIKYKNFTEAIKEWTNVLGLSATPTSTTQGVSLGTHQATRQSWKNACGYLVLDGFTSLGGDHGPSDALFKSNYVIPFLGLDKVGPVDPEIEQCGAGDGGVSPPRDSGAEASMRADAASSDSGGSGGNAGNGGAGGSAGTGGQSGSAGAGGSGGSAGSASNTGGSGGSAGSASNTGGSGGSGGSASNSGGSGGSGGSGVAGNNQSAGGNAGSGAAGQGGSGGSTTPAADGSGCSCSVGRARSDRPTAIAALAIGLAWAVSKRNRRRLPL
jgi:acetylxylan esterase